MHIAVEHHEVGALVVADDAALFGEVAHHLARIALVLNEKAEQIAVQAAVADMEGEPGLRAGKTAWLKDLGDEVGPDLGDETTQRAHACRRHEDIGEEDDDRHDGAKREEGGPDTPDRCA
jgi:hypothetical protein